MHSQKDTPLFVKTHDFIVWLLRHTQRFPKNLRHSYTIRLEQTCFQFEEDIVMANKLRNQQRRQRLEYADARLATLRSLLRYTLDFQLLGSNQYAFAAKSLEELGRLLGAWLKVTNR